MAESANLDLQELTPDPERGFVPFRKNDAVVNNMGGMGVLELYAVANQVLGRFLFSFFPLGLHICLLCS